MRNGNFEKFAAGFYEEKPRGETKPNPNLHLTENERTQSRSR
jgi:hypothetical protein